MMKKYITLGVICFLLGAGTGFLFAPQTNDLATSKPLLPRLTSQGREEVRKMLDAMGAVLNEDIGDIMAEKTRTLQAITAKTPDRTAANFYLSGMETKMSITQAKIDKILLDTVERMPAIDRRTYMDFYLEKRPSLRLHTIVLPLMAETAFEGQEEHKLKPGLPTVGPK